MQQVTRGHPLILEAFTHDTFGAVADATDVTVSIIDPDGSTVISLASPTHVGLGHYQYVFTAPDGAELGVWEAAWTADVDGFDESGSNFFLVVDVGADASRVCSHWTNIDQVRACCSGTTAATGTAGYVDDDTVQQAIGVATDLLYTLSGQQWGGVCTAVLRPCGENHCFGYYAAFLTQIPGGGGGGAYPHRSCGCGTFSSIDLGYWPVRTVTEVKIDGEVLSSSAYRLDAQRYLVRTDGEHWPSCQQLALPDSEEDTWSVSIEYGSPPPPAGVNAASKLACEFVKACAGIACQLPNRVHSVNRQQVNITMIDPSMLDNGLTGVYEVDLFLMAYNPAKSRGLTLVWSPDIGPASWT